MRLRRRFGNSTKSTTWTTVERDNPWHTSFGERIVVNSEVSACLTVSRAPTGLQFSSAANPGLRFACPGLLSVLPTGGNAVVSSPIRKFRQFEVPGTTAVIDGPAGQPRP
jgi:hypothetical protein